MTRITSGHEYRSFPVPEVFGKTDIARRVTSIIKASVAASSALIATASCMRRKTPACPLKYGQVTIPRAKGQPRQKAETPGRISQNTD